MAWKKWLALPVLAAVLAACGGGGDSSRCPLPPLVPGESVHVLASVLDAADNAAISGAKLGGAKVTVTIEGPAKDLVFVGGVPTKFFETTTGHVAFFVRPTAYPAVIRVVARAPNYISSSRELTIPGPGAHRVTVPLNSVLLPPPGVTVGTTAVSADANGVVASGFTLVTPVSATEPAAKRGATTVVMAPGTRVTDANGNPVTGTLDVRTTYHHNLDAGILDAFPGGLVVGEDPNGNPAPGAFISGGFASIEIAGGLAKFFDPPLTVTIVLPQGTLNPDTGLAVTAGDSIPLWSYDPGTGNWSVLRAKPVPPAVLGVIQPGTVGAADANGNFPVTFQTYHLSFFNLDWFRGVTQTCTAVFKHQGLATSLPPSAALTPADFGAQSVRFDFYRNGGGWGGYLFHTAGDSRTTLTRVPAGMPIKVVRQAAGTHAAGPEMTYTLIRATDGTCQDMVYAEADPTPPPTGTVTATVAIACQQDTSRRRLLEGSGVALFAGTDVAGYRQTNASGVAAIGPLLYGTYTAKAWANLDVRPGVTTEVSKSVTLSGSAASTELLFLVDCTVTGATGGTGATGDTGN